MFIDLEDEKLDSGSFIFSCPYYTIYVHLYYIQFFFAVSSLPKMPTSGKKFVKPGFLAQKTRYEIEREKTIEKNKEVMKSFGVKVQERDFSKVTTESTSHKRQCAVGDDEYVPPEGEDGLSDTEFDGNYADHIFSNMSS